MSELMNPMSGNYILVDKKPVQATSLEQWSQFMAVTENRRVALDELPGFWVSTVFLGIDHNFGCGEQPVLFETMVEWEGGQEIVRYCAWEEAEAGHKFVLERIKEEFGQKAIENQPALLENDQ